MGGCEKATFLPQQIVGISRIYKLKNNIHQGKKPSQLFSVVTREVAIAVGLLGSSRRGGKQQNPRQCDGCLLYTSDAADDPEIV